ncbi:alternative ribosome rescue aminoacyl-tRNA hydrolase ArfB [Ruania albidiflava]|uniref:alternative ribosome rescue aminoacyl-tRNA hydrolase ArfB n=1 Tax=Ruania albidiflava TaxID=366586 RepID=UPI0003B643AA|nr:alternative ribosome rescue aminoacyl-tRNA hydrolase ArfB [Ruania albidiflava]
MAGDDLRVPPGPGNPGGLVVPGSELTERFSRSSGPGGQAVNTTDTRVELLFDPGASTAFTPVQRRRVLRALGESLVGGQVRIVASSRASQLRNRNEARERLVALIREALMPPPPRRRPTRPSRRARQRRLDAKKQRGQTKALRRRPDGEGD